MIRNLFGSAKNVLFALLAMLVGVGGVGVASAQTTTDYSSILTGLDTSTAITAVIAAGALIAGVGFAKWATKKVGRFFG